MSSNILPSILLPSLSAAEHKAVKCTSSAAASSAKKVNPRRRAKVCALCPADCETTVSGSWYQISPQRTIVNTPVVLPFNKPGVYECCAKCYMKNRRLWEKRSSMLERSAAGAAQPGCPAQHRTRTAARSGELPAKDFGAQPALALEQFISRERGNVQASLGEIQQLKARLLQVAPQVTLNGDSTDKAVFSQFNVSVDIYHKLLSCLSAQLSGSGKAFDTATYSVYSTELKNQLSKMMGAFALFSMRPLLKSYLLMVLPFLPGQRPVVAPSSPVLSPITCKPEPPASLPALSSLIEEIERGDSAAAAGFNAPVLARPSGLLELACLASTTK